jgi:RND superfamily putative drug exporter
MKLLGERNWYLPSWLGWIPRFEHEPIVLGEPHADEEERELVPV